MTEGVRRLRLNAALLRTAGCRKHRLDNKRGPVARLEEEEGAERSRVRGNEVGRFGRVAPKTTGSGGGGGGVCGLVSFLTRGRCVVPRFTGFGELLSDFQELRAE